MRTPYSVWQWDQWNGWEMYLGSNKRDTADQVKRALQAYQPQYYYGVYGAYDFAPKAELVARWQGTMYTWGWLTTATNAVWVGTYALTKFLNARVEVGLRSTSGGMLVPVGQYRTFGAVGMPGFQVDELVNRRMAALDPRWAAEYA